MSTETVEPPQATDAEAIRARSRKLVKAPSGFSYLMRRAELSALIKSGALPENVVADALDIGRSPQAGETPDARRRLTMAQANRRGHSQQ